MARVFQISSFNSSENQNKLVDLALEFLKFDGIIAMPSDTLYGLFARFKPELIDRLHQIKKRGQDKPFLIVLPENFSPDCYLDSSRIDENIKAAILQYWPGKNTLILPKNPEQKYPPGNSIAMRKPDKVNNPFFYDVLNRLNEPLLAPSLNLHLENPLSSLDQILETFGNSIDAVFYDAQFAVKAPSNLIDLTVKPYSLLRGSIGNNN